MTKNSKSDYALYEKRRSSAASALQDDSVHLNRFIKLGGSSQQVIVNHGRINQEMVSNSRPTFVKEHEHNLEYAQIKTMELKVQRPITQQVTRKNKILKKPAFLKSSNVQKQPGSIVVQSARSKVFESRDLSKFKTSIEHVVFKGAGSIVGDDDLVNLEEPMPNSNVQASFCPWPKPFQPKSKLTTTEKQKEVSKMSYYQQLENLSLKFESR